MLANPVRPGMRVLLLVVAATIAAAPVAGQGFVKLVVIADGFEWTEEPASLPGVYRAHLVLRTVMPLNPDEACVCSPTFETNVTLAFDAPREVRDLVASPSAYTIHWWTVGPEPATRGTHVQHVNVSFAIDAAPPGVDLLLTIYPSGTANMPIYEVEGLPTQAVIVVPYPEGTDPAEASDAEPSSQFDPESNATTLNTLTVVEGGDEEELDEEESALPAIGPIAALMTVALVAMARRRRA